jgi:hypothetical protein
MRALVLALTLLALLVSLPPSAGCTRPPVATISIDFSMYPEEFEGLEVEIDGEVVGRLEPVGQYRRNGFTVMKGTHTVRVLHPEYDCPPVEVNADNAALDVILMMDIGERYDEKGGYRTVIDLIG